MSHFAFDVQGLGIGIENERAAISDARSRDPEPSEPLGLGPRVKTCSSSCSSWPHLLKSWSLRQSRGGSMDPAPVSFHDDPVVVRQTYETDVNTQIYRHSCS